MSASSYTPGGGSRTRATSTDELITGEAVALEVRPTGFMLRAVGDIVDVLISGLLLLGGFLLLGLASVAAELDQAAVAAFSSVILVTSTVIVPCVVETATHGRSVGRLIIGARIVRDDGGAASFRHALIRALVGFFEIYLTFGGVAAISGLLSERSKRLGDILAGTYSQHERVPRIPDPALGLPPQLASWAPLADVGRLPDPLARRVAQYLREAGALSPESRARRGYELAAETSAYVSPVPPVAPEIFLAGVSALRRDREFAALQLEKQRLARLEPALRGLPHDFPDR